MIRFYTIAEMEMLAQGKMQVRHWNTLFEECQHPNLYPSLVKLDDLFRLGIRISKRKDQK
jgi:hypothetical protein